MPTQLVQSRSAYRSSVLRYLGSSAISIALDTEFQLGHTLTIQAAARLGRRLLVQLYHSPAIPPLPSDLDLQDYLPRTAGGYGYGEFFDALTLRRPKRIHSRLSPVELLNDLFGIHPPLTPVSRESAYALLWQNGPFGDRDSGVEGRSALQLQLVLVGHFWPSDFLRVFGHEFYYELLQRPTASPSVQLFDGKIMRCIVKHPGFIDFNPAVQFARDADGTLYRVTLDSAIHTRPLGQPA